MAEWANQDKFWAETIRNVLITAVGGYLAIMYFKPHENLSKKRMEMRVAVIDNYLESSYKYTSAMYDVIINEKDFKDIQKELDQYRSDSNILQVYFQNDPDITSQKIYVDTLVNRLYNNIRYSRLSQETLKQLRTEVKKEHNKVGHMALTSLNFFEK